MIKEQLVKLIPIQASCVQQKSDSNGKQDWEVYSNDGELLYTLPKRFTEKEIMEIQKYTKKFEKLGFDAGSIYIEDSKNIEIKSLEKSYQLEFERMKNENDRISGMLEKYMLENIEDDEDEQSKIGIPKHMQ